MCLDAYIDISMEFSFLNEGEGTVQNAGPVFAELKVCFTAQTLDRATPVSWSKTFVS